jgi:Tfp pilus assembly protein PilO
VSRPLRILLAAVAAIAAVAGYWKLALAPKRQQAAQLEQQLSTARSQLATAQTTLAGYERAKDAYRSNYATVVRLGKAVPSDDDTRSLLVQLSAAAKRSGIDFSSIDVSQAGSSGGSATTSTTGSTTGAALPPGAVSAGAFSELPFSFAFTGHFAGLSAFFGRLERFVTVQQKQVGVAGRLLRVSSIDLELGQDGWPSIAAKIGATAYIVPAAQPLAAGGSASASSAAARSAASAAAGSSSSSVPTATATNLR